MGQPIEMLEEVAGPDIRYSQDLEDVVVILDGTEDLMGKLPHMPDDVKKYLGAFLTRVSRDEHFDDVMASVFERQDPAPYRRERIRQFIEALCR